MMQTMGSASTGEHLFRLVVAAALCVVSLVHADDTTFIVGGNYTATWPTGPHGDYLDDADSLGSNFVYLSCHDLGDSLGGDTLRLKPVLASAQARHMRVCLSSVWIDTLGLTIDGASTGLWHRYEAESICGAGDIGQNVPDQSAKNGCARRVEQVSGSFQSNPTGIWGAVSSLPYTGVFRLRADTAGCSPGTPVCSLVVSEFYRDDAVPPPVKESVVGRMLLVSDSFQSKSQYHDFAIHFLRVTGTISQCRFRVFSFGNADSLWSDNVELFDAYADGLLRLTSGSEAPLARKVRLAAGRYNPYPAVYRFMMKDEPEPDMFRSCAAVRRAVEAAPPYNRSGITWVNWWDDHPERFERYVDEVNPKELWLDNYPLMGRTWPHQDMTTGGGRTPLDSGARFQGRLDSMCTALDLARTASKEHSIPLWFDVQAFSEAQTTSPNYPYNSEWNSGPPQDTMQEGIWREPTPRELRCMVWLALAYGVKGITYWLFPTVPGSWHAPGWDPKYFYLLGLTGFHYTGGNQPFGYPEGHRPIFDTTRSMNGVLQQIGPKLLQLQSVAVGRWHGSPVGFVQSSTDSLMQFGTFTDPSAQYFIAVNRDCRKDSVRYDTVGLNLSSTAPSYFLHDEVTGQAISPLPGSGGSYWRFPLRFEPGQGRLLKVVAFQGWLERNRDSAFSNMMQIALEPGFSNGTDQLVDSVQFVCHFSPTGQDTAITFTDSTGWIGYHDKYVYRVRFEGWNRFSLRYKLSGGIVTPEYWATAITLDTSLPHDSMNINHNAQFTTVPSCTLCSYTSDAISGPGQMQFTNDWQTNPELIADPGLSDTSYWVMKNCELVESLGVVRLDAVPNSQSYLYHRIPAESIEQYQGWQMVLAADCVSDSFPPGTTLGLSFLYVASDSQFGHDTIVMPEPRLMIEPGTVARVGSYNYSVQFPFYASPPANHHLLAVDVGIFRSPGPESGGKLWIGSLSLVLVPAAAAGNPPGWLPYHAEYYPWQIGSIPGVHIVKARYQDLAGNEGEWVADAIVLDNLPPIGSLDFPSWGQVMTDSIVEVLGLAFDPPLPWDPFDSLHLMSHFQSYKLTWSPANGTGGDSSFGILPESLFFSPALPPEPDPTGAGQETPRLAWWNTRPIIDQYGVGFYCLTLTVLDSAGNQSVAQTVVYLDTSSKDATGAGDAGSGALSLATTPENDLLVGTTTGTITQYTSELDSVQSMTIQDSTGPAVITGLATDPSGAIYLGDTRDRNVKVCDEQGNPTDTIGSHTQLTTPNSVAIARNGDVYVADRSRNVIRVYGQDNTLKLSFGEPGSDTGQFLGAYALALSYTTALDFQVSLDSSGSPRMETTSTTLTRCLIADKGNHRIQVFDHAGRYLASFGDSVLSQPVGLSVDTSNCRYVADQGNKAIYGFDPNGTLFLTITAADTMTPIATTISSDNGSLYTIDQNTHQLLKYLVSYTDTAEMGGGQSGAIKPIPAPRELILEQSRPNPANQSLTIRYGIPRLTNISLKVYDISGRLVRTLKNDDQHKPGYYNITWNCKDNRDRAIPNGIYFYRLTSDDKLQSSSHKSQTRVKTRKLVIAR